MDRNFFDYTLNFNLDMAPVDRSFDPVKVQNYLSRMSEPDRSFIQELLNRTTYIKYSDLKQALFQSFQSFKQKIGQQEFYLMLPAGKFGSEYWLVALLWPQIRTMNLKGIIKDTDNFQPQGPTNILVIDDAIYSGARMVEMFENITQGNRQKSKFFNFHLVVPFITQRGTDYILGVCKNLGASATVFGIYYLPSLESIINIESFYPPQPSLYEDYEEYIVDVILSRFGIPGLDMPAVYFDHKAAGEFSTFSSVYLQGRLPDGTSFGPLFKVNPSREKIEQLAQLYANFNK